MEHPSPSKSECCHTWVIVAAVAFGLGAGLRLRKNPVPEPGDDGEMRRERHISESAPTVQPNDLQEQEREREIFRKNADDAHASANEDQKQYDTQLLLLSSAFLAASLAFIKDVVHIREAIHLRFLDASFILFGLCIFMVLYSFQFSIHCQYLAKDYWEEIQRGNLEAKFPYRSAKTIKWLNRLAGIVFATGVVCTAFFVLSNLNREAYMTDTKFVIRNGVNDGQMVKLPSTVPTSSNGFDKGSNLKTPPPPGLPQPERMSSGTSNQQPQKPKS